MKENLNSQEKNEIKKIRGNFFETPGIQTSDF